MDDAVAALPLLVVGVDEPTTVVEGDRLDDTDATALIDEVTLGVIP